MTSKPRVPRTRGQMKVAGAMTGRIDHYDLGQGWSLAHSKNSDGHEVMTFSAPEIFAAYPGHKA
jgi:hypothetical protein